MYALGVLLYRLLSGHAPWSADTTTQMLNAHIYVEPVPLAALPDVPDYVITLCNRCLHKDPAQRPSAREAAALLARGAGLRVVEDEPPAGAGRADEEPSLLLRPPAGTPLMSLPEAGTPPAADPPAPPVTGSRRRALPVAVAALLAGAGVLAVLFLPDDPRGAGPVVATDVEPRTGGDSRAVSAGPSPAGRAASRPAGHAAVDGTAGRDAGPAPAGTPIGTSGPSTDPVSNATAGNPAPPPRHDEPAPTATTTQPAPPPARTLASAGGTVRATCPAPATAHLLSWTPAKSSTSTA